VTPPSEKPRPSRIVFWGLCFLVLVAVVVRHLVKHARNFLESGSLLDLLFAGLFALIFVAWYVDSRRAGRVDGKKTSESCGPGGP